MASSPTIALIPTGTKTIRKIQIRILPFLFIFFLSCTSSPILTGSTLDLLP
jgi:hypothetical protein